MKTYDVSFTPFVSIVVAEQDEGEFQIVGAEIDWSGSFLNCWLNNARQDNTEEIVPDEGDDLSHPACAAGVEYLDHLVTAHPNASRELMNSELLRQLADLMESWRPVKAELRARVDEVELKAEIDRLKAEIAEREAKLLTLTASG